MNKHDNPTSDLETRKVMITLFRNKAATKLEVVGVTLHELADLIKTKTAADKTQLPLLKMAIFGDERTKKNCLRNNANVLNITGVDAEHDAETMSFDTAVETLRAANIRSLLYTSPSYVPATKERWRILVPLSKEHPPDTRVKMVARVNGLLKGQLSGESFTLSQAYYYGHVNNPAHRVEVVDGDFLDLRDDTYAGSIFKGGFPDHLKDYKSTGAGTDFEPSDLPGRDDDELKALLETSRIRKQGNKDGKWRASMLAATATMIGRGWSDAAIKLACAQYCDGGADDPELEAYINDGRKKFKKPNEERGPNDGEIERLAALSPLEYDPQRKEAAKKLGVRTKVLDEMVAAARQRQEDASEAAATDDYATIARVNIDHALVLSGNKAAVMKFESGTKFRLLQISAFKQWFSNQLITIGKEVTTVGAYWLGHPKRRGFEGIEFEPGGGGRDGYYNLWQGFAVKRKEGDCSKFLAHVKDNAARGDEATFLWIIGWWAQIFQQPTVKMETSLGFRGQQGTGKTKIGQVMGSLIGEDHYSLVSNPRYITGQFNSHMASLLVLHADEAFWAGDKKSEGTLKDLVTGLHHMLEFKGIDQIRVKNYIRLFITGNQNWLIPAGFKERRFAIFDMGEDHIQDHAYFAAIDQEMNDGGREALLHYLMNFDLTQVDLRKIPKTAALLDQQIESMTPEQAWWMETLMRGTLPELAKGGEPRTSSKEAIYRRYVRHAKLQGANRRSTETRLGIFLRDQLGGELRIPKPYDGKRQVPCFQFPPLAECRTRFAGKIGGGIEWGEGWEKEEWVHVHEKNDDEDELF